MIPQTCLYDEYIDRPKLTEQKKPIWVYSSSPHKYGRNNYRYFKEHDISTHSTILPINLHHANSNPMFKIRCRAINGHAHQFFLRLFVRYCGNWSHTIKWCNIIYADNFVKNHLSKINLCLQYHGITQMQYLGEH